MACCRGVWAKRLFSEICEATSSEFSVRRSSCIMAERVGGLFGLAHVFLLQVLEDLLDILVERGDAAGDQFLDSRRGARSGRRRPATVRRRADRRLPSRPCRSGCGRPPVARELLRLVGEDLQQLAALDPADLRGELLQVLGGLFLRLLSVLQLLLLSASRAWPTCSARPWRGCRRPVSSAGTRRRPSRIPPCPGRRAVRRASAGYR